MANVLADIIENLDPGVIQDHPMQAKIYGISKPDEEMIESVRERGIITPLRVSRRPDGLIVNVAGHTRATIALMLELPTVPCIVAEYESEDEEIADLIHSNKGRVKTEAQINLEISMLKKVISKINKKKQLSGLQGIGNKDGYGDSEAFGDKTPNGDTNSIIGEKLGKSKEEIKRRAALCDDESLQKFLKKCKGITDKQEANYIAARDALRQKQESKEMTLGAAYQELMEIQNELLQKLGIAPKEEKPKSKKPEPPVSKIKVCAEIGGLKAGFITDNGVVKVAVENEAGKVDVFEWDNVLKHVVLPLIK